ncbi:hypothetical protein GQR58_014644 [Nymphon striatum]|nr:hypothetical protein GQR58_014644 [Nymphon striatum]
MHLQAILYEGEEITSTQKKRMRTINVPCNGYLSLKTTVIRQKTENGSLNQFLLSDCGDCRDNASMISCESFFFPHNKSNKDHASSPIIDNNGCAMCTPHTIAIKTLLPQPLPRLFYFNQLSDVNIKKVLTVFAIAWAARIFLSLINPGFSANAQPK